MYKYDVTYEDFNGETREKTLYFNLSIPEMIDLENTTPGGYGAKIEQIAKERDTREAYLLFQELMSLSYGEKSPDGTRFLKKDPNTGKRLFDEFSETPEYEAFIVDLITKPNVASAFASQIVPEKYIDKIQGDLGSQMQVIQSPEA